MTSEQICPLCKDKLIYSNVQYRCNKIKCYFFGNRIHSHEIDLINAQISRIKQQAFEEGQKSVERHTQERIAKLEKENIDLKKQLSKMNSSLQIKLNKTRKLANRYNKALAFRKKDSVSLSYLRLEISKLANELEKEDMRNITVSYVQNLVKRLRGEK